MIRFLHVCVCLFVLAFVFEVSSQAASPSGKWRGHWSSQATGHSGVLRARIRQVDANTYRALFSGRFAKIVPFIYPAKLQRIPGTWNQYQSRTRLPLLGEYRMTATVGENQFHARFQGRRDGGVFQMQR